MGGALGEHAWRPDLPWRRERAALPAFGWARGAGLGAAQPRCPPQGAFRPRRGLTWPPSPNQPVVARARRGTAPIGPRTFKAPTGEPSSRPGPSKVLDSAGRPATAARRLLLLGWWEWWWGDCVAWIVWPLAPPLSFFSFLFSGETALDKAAVLVARPVQSRSAYEAVQGALGGGEEPQWLSPQGGKRAATLGAAWQRQQQRATNSSCPMAPGSLCVCVCGRGAAQAGGRGAHEGNVWGRVDLVWRGLDRRSTKPP
jgi:hypothetical protein